MQSEALETTVDRGDDFDQTKLHIIPATPLTESVEERIQRLESELRSERLEHLETAARLSVAETRIEGLQRISAGLSAAVDSYETRFRKLAEPFTESERELRPAA